MNAECYKFGKQNITYVKYSELGVFLLPFLMVARLATDKNIKQHWEWKHETNTEQRFCSNLINNKGDLLYSNLVVVHSKDPGLRNSSLRQHRNTCSTRCHSLARVDMTSLTQIGNTSTMRSQRCNTTRSRQRRWSWQTPILQIVEVCLYFN